MSEPASKKAKTSSSSAAAAGAAAADNTYPVLDRVASGAHVRGMAAYRKMYARSIDDNEAFWADMAAKVRQLAALSLSFSVSVSLSLSLSLSVPLSVSLLPPSFF